MHPLRDPEGVEAKHLTSASQFTGKEVLEIGCGYGWLTWKYAHIANRVYGIDPGFFDLQKAKISESGAVTNVTLAQAIGEALPFPSDKFDISVFSSSF